MLASVATARTDALLAARTAVPAAMAGGYHAAFMLGAAFAIVAALIGMRLRAAPNPAAMQGLQGATQ